MAGILKGDILTFTAPGTQQTTVHGQASEFNILFLWYKIYLTQKNFTLLDCLFIVFSKYDKLTNAILEDTMAKTTTISVRMDADLKSDAESILSSLGLTPSQAISVFYKQITFQHGLPFPVKIPEKKLNAVSIGAMEEKDLDEYKNSSELYSELGI